MNAAKNAIPMFAAMPSPSTNVSNANTRTNQMNIAASVSRSWNVIGWRGTRRDGSPHAMAGVTVFGVADGRAAWARFYLEPVDQQGDSVDDAVRRVVGRPDEPATEGARP